MQKDLIRDVSFRIATDIGGTFTDIVTLKMQKDGSQSINFLKSHTTPPHFEQGVIDGIKKTGIPLEDIANIVHGTTVVINTLTERKGVKTALITTEGFRDILEIGRGDRPDFFNLNYKKPKPFIARYLRKEIPGRISYQGKILKALDLKNLQHILTEFQAEQVQAIAICLVNSYANPAHEKSVLAAIQNIWPEVTVVASYQITREWREYERTNTAVLSAYVKPIAQNYLKRFSSALKHKQYQGGIDIMQSNGGVNTIQAASESPIKMVESGPAGGVWGAAALGKLINRKNLIAFDVGGTTAKCSLIYGGHVPLKTDYMIEQTQTSPGYPINVSVVDIVEIGNGGGSIAWFDECNKLHVGPQSAGAIPGPVAYGKGGSALTTTDALLALGRINPQQFCGGELSANMPAVNRIAEKTAKLHNFSAEDLMRGIIRLANHNMINALKLISVNKGYDPRDFSLIAFGGGGGLHACELAHELGINEIIIPHAAAVFSAWGMLLCDLRYDFIQTKIISLSDSNSLDVINKSLANIEKKALKSFTHEHIASEDIRFEHYGRFRYQNQEHFVEVELPPLPLDITKQKQMIDNFTRAYKRKYTYQLDIPIELMCFHTVALAEINKLKPNPKKLTKKSAEHALIARRAVDYMEAGIHHSAIYDNELLKPGMTFTGPAIVESSSSSTVILPGMRVQIDSFGNLRINTTIESTLSKQITNDVITLEIIQNALQFTAEEMFAAMRRTAMSPIIYEVLDMGTAITDAKGQLTSSGAGIPAFVNMLDKSIKHILNRFKGRGIIQPGDIYIVNHPYYGGVTHLNDIVLAMPVFSEEQNLIAWTANIAHWSDIGGMSPGGITTEAKELMQEGLQIPPIKVFAKGKLIESVLDLICANSRMPDFLRGDFWAGVAAVRVGEKRIQELITKYGQNNFIKSISHYLDYAEQVTRSGLQALPKSEIKFAEKLDNGDTLRVSINIEQDKFIVNLRDNPNQNIGPTNISREATEVAVEALFKAITAPTSVCNAGSFRCLEVLTRKGSVFDPIYPAPMGIYYELLIRLHDLLWHAMANHMPEKLPAGGFASICGTLFGGKHPDTGKKYSVIEPELGGWGASSGHDGNSALFSGIHGNTYNCPAEVSEARNGVLVNRYSFYHSPGGEGKYRGGKGVCIEYQIRSDEAWLTASYTRSKEKPWALNGGQPGSPNLIEIARTSGDCEQYSQVSGLSLNQGDVIRILTGTGAGWGNPAERDESLVIEDLKNEYITLEQARKYFQLDKRNPTLWASIASVAEKSTEKIIQSKQLVSL